MQFILKAYLSTKIDFFKLSLNSYAAKDTNCVLFLTRKKTIAIGIISRMTRIEFNPTLFI